MKIELIIHSDDAEAVAALRETAQRLRGDGHRVAGRITFEAGDAERFAAEAVGRGVDLVVAAGGDGTLNEVANGLLRDAGEGGSGALPRLGIVPLGTANDFAAWLEIPAEVTAAVDVAVTGIPTIVDAGRLNERVFLNVSTGGFGAESSDDAPERVKRSLGALAYVVTGVREVASLEPSTARFTSGDEVVYDGEFLLMAVGNGRRTGGGNWLTPRASAADGLLDLCLVPAMTTAEFLRLLPDLRSGAHIANEQVIYRQVRELRVEPATELSVNADGEPVQARRFTYSVLPGALTIMKPRT